MAPASAAEAASDAVLARLMRLHPKVIDLSLARIERLCARLGNPERALPPVLHVAGTNGKGSVVAFLRAMFEAAGYRVHVYTSPHLVRFHERIRLAGRLIDEARLIALLEECEAANGADPITFFEVTTAAAFLAFAREPADVVLLETGLGGRLDATNLVACPRVTAITPVDLDHMSFLGNTVEKIAAEKAGILKPGAPAVIGPQLGPSLAVLEARAQAIGAPLYRYGREWRVEARGAHLHYSGRNGSIEVPLPKLEGAHQHGNAGIALACIDCVPQFGVSGAALADGLRRVEWPARLQRLKRGPLASLLPNGVELWLDGGHNPAAGVVLAEHMRDRWSDFPVYLIYGMLATKDAEGFLRPLAGRVQGMRAVEIPGESASLTAADAAAAARRVGLTCEPAATLEAAIGATIAQLRGPARILICGSLYLAGRVLAENG
jgi:dihydrofolate synthase / folylpolyglutamate synthase